MSTVITKIEPQKRNKNRFNLFDADGFFTSLSMDSLLKYHVKEGMALSDDLLAEMKKEDTVKYAKEISVAYIAYTPRTEHQVREHLKKKDIDVGSIEETIQALYHYAFLDDAAYVRSFVSSYSHKLGEQAMRMKLKERGVSKSVIDANLSVDEDSQKQVAKALADKLFARYEGQEPYKAKQKVYAALTRKGFSYDVIKSVLQTED